MKAPLLAVGLVGVATIFLPFTSGDSPWDVISGRIDFGFEFILLAAPTLLAIPISVSSLVLLIKGSVRRSLWIAVYALAIAAAISTLFFWTSGLLHDDPPSDAEGWLGAISFLLLVAALLTFGVGLVIRNARHGVPNSANAIVAAQAAYVVNTGFALYLFVPGAASLATGTWEPTSRSLRSLCMCRTRLLCRGLQHGRTLRQHRPSSG